MKKLVTPPFQVTFIEGKDANDLDKWKHFLFDGLVQIDQKTKVPTGKLRYTLCALWTPAKFTDRGKAQWKEILDALNGISLETFKREWSKLPDNIKRGIKDGTNAPYAGFGPGTKFANLSCTKPESQAAPEVIDINWNPVTKANNTVVEDDGTKWERLYPGCWARATVNPYSFKMDMNKGLALGFRNIQILNSKSPRLDGGVGAKEDFGSEDDDFTVLMNEMSEEAVEE